MAQKTTQEVAILSSPELNKLAAMKDSSALGDEADGGFGEGTIEKYDFEGCVSEGVHIANTASKSGECEVWEVKLDPMTLYFIGSFDTVLRRIANLPEETGF